MEDKKHIVAITALIKNKIGDKFLIVKRHKNEIAFPGKWAFPGGKVERGQDILETLRKEIMEEVGLEIEDFKKFIKDYTFIRPDGHNVVGFCFEVITKTEEVIISEDFEDFKWITPEELLDFDHIKGMEEEVNKVFNKE